MSHLQAWQQSSWVGIADRFALVGPMALLSALGFRPEFVRFIVQGFVSSTSYLQAWQQSSVVGIADRLALVGPMTLPRGLPSYRASSSTMQPEGTRYSIPFFRPPSIAVALLRSAWMVARYSDSLGQLLGFMITNDKSYRQPGSQQFKSP